jgi:hypothetical protein
MIFDVLRKCGKNGKLVSIPGKMVMFQSFCCELTWENGDSTGEIFMVIFFT